ncbi:Fic family protein [Parapedobacter sp.]
MENRTATQITSKERIGYRFWNPVTIREAVINSIVHNDFTREVPPKFELFADRIEIISIGTLPEGLSEEDFFNGVSIPRNRGLMRVYRDLELVEQLGSGVPRILESYGKECFRFMGNFIRMIFSASEVVTPQVKKLINVFEGIHNRTELQSILGLLDREHFRKSYLQPAIDAGLVALTIPDKPTSSRQRYVLTDLGKQLKDNRKEKHTK